jgi:hypothetical protein
MILLSYLHDALQKVSRCFQSRVHGTFLKFNPLRSSKTNITRDVLAAYNESAATQPEETMSNN